MFDFQIKKFSDIKITRADAKGPHLQRAKQNKVKPGIETQLKTILRFCPSAHKAATVWLGLRAQLSAKSARSTTTATPTAPTTVKSVPRDSTVKFVTAVPKLPVKTASTVNRVRFQPGLAVQTKTLAEVKSARSGLPAMRG